MRELGEDPRRTARAAMVATYKRCHMGRVAARSRTSFEKLAARKADPQVARAGAADPAPAAMA